MGNKQQHNNNDEMAIINNKIIIIKIMDDGENNHPKLTILEDYECKPSNVGKHVDYGISILEKNCTLFVPKEWYTECVFLG